ncbi:hypothetical protein [Sphingobacterium humi]|uniref:DUF4843 domain-containing protein n=1 Tax=Sphingobacterium humi TaxID=1796905 RepID=A0A6N8L3E8_9SPHI|nr:hypothetical protein [Sphingobacterium humi]MVZ63031.1 hypothetical protein [Sphingobacterium humi]
MKRFFIAIIAILFVGSMSSCDKEYSEFYSDNRPEIPVTFEGATTHGFNPYYIQKVSQNDITITMNIPTASGKQIKEISKALGGATSINAGGVRTSTYLAAPVAGQGTKAVFKTSLTAFKAYSAANAKLINDFVAGAGTQIQIAFMFVVKLDDGQEIIPVPVQIWLQK